MNNTKHTPGLEMHGPVIALHKYSYVVNEREELKQQRDALLVALSAFIRYTNGTTDNALEILNQEARAAIAKVRAISLSLPSASAAMKCKGA